MSGANWQGVGPRFWAAAVGGAFVSGPAGFAVEVGQVRFGRIGAGFEKCAPAAAAKQAAVVLHVATHAAERVSVRTAAIRLQRVRGDRPQKAGRSREDVLDRGFGEFEHLVLPEVGT